MTNTTNTQTIPSKLSSICALSESSPRLDNRYADFIAVCRRIISQTPKPLSYNEVLAQACKTPAPSYYVEYYYALRKLRAVRRMPPEKALKASHGRWAEIDGRVRALEAKGIVHHRAVERVLIEGNASGFFLIPSTVRRHLRRIYNSL